MIKNLYLSNVKLELKKFPPIHTDVITEKDIESLPDPVQRFFRYCGYVGLEKMTNAEIKWENAYIKRDPQGSWMPLETVQFNSVPEPARVVYLHSKILGIIPFEGRDVYQDGKGNMLIKALRFLTVVDDKGKEMDRSELVTVLSEVLLVPNYAFQEYVHWEEIDSHSARASINFQGNRVSGVFHFNEEGKFIKFETNDRYYSENGKNPQNFKWSVLVENYTDKNGLKIPSTFKVVWKMDEGDFGYFKGDIKEIRFNITHPEIGFK